MASQLLNQLQKGQIYFFWSWGLLMSVRMFLKCSRLNFPWPGHPGIISGHPLFTPDSFLSSSAFKSDSHLPCQCVGCVSLQIFHSVGCSKEPRISVTASGRQLSFSLLFSLHPDQHPQISPRPPIVVSSDSLQLSLLFFLSGSASFWAPPLPVLLLSLT